MDRYQTGKKLLYYLRAAPDKIFDRRPGVLSGADWDSIIEESARHGIAPLLYHRLKTLHSGISIPPGVMGILQKAHLGNAARNMDLYNRIGKILGAFRRAGISAIVLKGAYLASAVYESLALRQMNDTDLLVKQADLSKASDIMGGLGYTSSKEDVYCDPNHLPKFGIDGRAYVEIHFNIIGPPFAHRVDIEKLWARAQKVSIAGIEALALCPEDLLVHLCAHAGFKHGFETGVRPLFDISHTIERYGRGIDWEEVLKRSREWGVGRSVYLALSLAERLAGAGVPEEIIRKLELYKDGFDAAACVEGLLFESGSPIATNVARLYGEECLRDKLVHFMKYAFPPADIMAAVNSTSENPPPVYYLYFSRIKGLVKRHSRTAWRLFLGDKELAASADIENRRNALKDWLVQPQ